MPLFWVLRDGLDQLETLAGQHTKLVLARENNEEAPGGLVANDVKRAMQKEQCLLQKFADAESLPELLKRLRLIEIKNRPPPPPEPVAAKRNRKMSMFGAGAPTPAKANNAPHKTDKQASIDEQRDETLCFFILDTMHKILASIMHVDGFHKKQNEFVPNNNNDEPVNPQCLSEVDPSLIQYYFGFLKNTDTSVAARLAASKCIGVLSRYFLDHCVKIFTVFPDLKKEQDQREYSIVQSGVKFLHFGVGTGEQLRLTLLYLNSLIKFLKGVERGVLRKEVCDSLVVVLTAVMASNDPERQREWEQFSNSGKKHTAEFYKCYMAINSQICKWSKKVKHSLFCYDLLYRMVVMCSNYDFYSSKDRNNVLHSLLKQLNKGEKGDRPTYLKYIHNYVKDLPKAFVDRNLKAFTQQCTDVIKEIMKIKNPEKEEQQMMTEILIKTGQKHFHFVVHQVVGDSLEYSNDKGYSPKQKAMWLTALGKLAETNKEAIQDHNYHLGPIIFQYLLSEQHFMEKNKKRKDVLLGREDQLDMVIAALSCFPNIRPKLPDELQAATAAIGTYLTVHPDRGISTAAALCMQKFFSLDPRQNLIPTLYCFVDILGNLDLIRETEMMKIVNTVEFLLIKTVKYLEKDDHSLVVTASDWTSLRQHMECACMLWLCHTNTIYRSTIARVLELFCCDAFRALEKSGSGVNTRESPFLVDKLFPQGNVSAIAGAEGFPTQFFKIIKDREGFEGVFSWAWTKMNKHVTSLSDMLDEDFQEDNIKSFSWETPEKNNQKTTTKDKKDKPRATVPGITMSKDAYTKLYITKLRFLCVLLHEPEVGELPVPNNHKRQKSSVVLKPHIFCEPPRLETFVVDKKEFDTFFQKMMFMLHSSDFFVDWKAAIALSVKQALSELLSGIDSSCYSTLTCHLRGVSQSESTQAPSGTPHKKRKQSELSLPSSASGALDYLHHEHTLDIISRLMGHVLLSGYKIKSDILFTTLDQIIDHWVKDHKDRQGEGIRRHSSLGKRHIVDLITHYIELKRRESKSQPDNDENAKHYTLFELITQRLMPASDTPSDSVIGTPTRPRTETKVNTPVSALRTNALKHTGNMRSGVKRLMRRRSSLAPNEIETSRSQAHGIMGLTNGDEEDEDTFELMGDHFPLLMAESKDDSVSAGIQGLEIALLKALCSLIQSIGSMNDPEFLGMIMGFIHRVSFRGAHLHDGISKALEVVMTHHPALALNFVEKTFAKAHLTENNSLLLNMDVQSGQISSDIHRLIDESINGTTAKRVEHASAHLRTYAREVAKLYAKAVLNNFIQRLEHWVQEGISPATILLTSLMHQTNDDCDTRTLALSLARALSDRRTNPLTPTMKIRLYSHKQQMMYTQGTVEYSRSLAARATDHPWVIRPLFMEAAKFNDIMGFEKCDALLRVLVPWVGQVGIVLQKKRLKDKRKFMKNYLLKDNAKADNGKVDAEVEQAALDIMRPLFHLTSECHKNDRAKATTPTLVNLWNELLAREYAVLVVPQVIKFLVIQYTNANDTEGGEDSSQLLLPKMLLLNLSRSRDEEMSKLIIDQLAKLLRHYTQECPEAPGAFLNWQKEKKSEIEPVSSTESNAFQLILNLVFENGKLFEQHFPALLQNACVLFKGTEDAEAMVSYILLHLNIQDNGQPMTQERLVKELLASCPQVAKQWAVQALEWAIKTSDQRIAVQSLRLFRMLQSGGKFDFGDGQLTLIQLVASLTMSIRLDQINRTHEICNILLMPETVVPYDTQGWISITGVGWSLLCLSQINYFKLGLSLLTHMFRYEGVPHSDRSDWLMATNDHLHFFRRTKEQDFDEAIAQVALKGFTSSDTAQSTVEVLQSLAPFYTSHLKPSNKLMALLMLGSFLLRTRDIQETNKRKIDDLSRSKLQARVLSHLQRALDTAGIAVLLHEYEDCQHADENTKAALNSLADVMKEMAKDLGNQVPGLSISRILRTNDKAEDTAEGVLELLTQELTRRSTSTATTANTPAAATDTTTNEPIVEEEAKDPSLQFFTDFTAIFSDQESFDFIITFFITLLTNGDRSWKPSLLGMLGYFLQCSRNICSTKQFEELSELMVQSYYAPSATVLRRAENIAYILAHKSEFMGDPANAFNFVRPLQKPQRRKSASSTLFCAFRDVEPVTVTDQTPGGSEVTTTIASEKDDCLYRIEKQTFPILHHMYMHPRAIMRDNDDPNLGKVLPTRNRASSSGSGQGGGVKELPEELSKSLCASRSRASSAASVSVSHTASLSKTHEHEHEQEKEQEEEQNTSMSEANDTVPLQPMVGNGFSYGGNMPEFLEGTHQRYGSTPDNNEFTSHLLSPEKLEFTYEGMKYHTDDEEGEDTNLAEVDGLVLVESSPGRGGTLRNAINIVPAPTADEEETIRKFAFDRDSFDRDASATREKSNSTTSNDSTRSFSRKYSRSGTHKRGESGEEVDKENAHSNKRWGV